MEPITTDVLIGHHLFDFTHSIKGSDNILNFYIHAKGGDTKIQGGPYGPQIINSLSIPSNDQSFILKTLYELEQEINLSFNLTSNYETSDIALFYDTEISIGADNTVGLAYTNVVQNRGWWEIILDAKTITDNNYLRYATIHELGHSLGLEHPFDARDGDVYNGITSPWESLYPEDTVMAYRHPKGDKWSENYTINDLTALKQIWGAQLSPYTQSIEVEHFGTTDNDLLKGISDENYTSELLVGGVGDDTLKGYRGADILLGGMGDDELRAGNGRDTLTGGQGVDSLFGGFGRNTFEDSDDGYADELYFKSDQLAYNYVYDKAGNSPNGEKADKIGGLDSIDKVYIQGATDTQLTFAEGISHTRADGEVMSGIGIYAGGTLEAVYTGASHSLAQLKSMVFGADA